MSKAIVAYKGDGQHELIQLVSFNLGAEEYAVEVLKVREIIRMTAITHVPNTSHGVEGIINLRGKVIPIISLRSRFGMMPADYDHHTRIMVMDIDGKLMGFVVDGVSEVIRISSAEIQPPPDMVGGADQDFISGVIQHGDHLLLLLQLDKMFAGDDSFNFDELSM
ncbi:chemotaxis protein CheW [Geomesophilobacter sediminis]|uniref:Purine-binding chemotaxis protein CheW n=1 Tax=Geomesophilobacter sediminis TaxID=2798584 RepID=A0A8J7JB54_9BACT|nr:chemotaxis protein CheW [Geomesophilobacter sediminis]MBJ6723743.1 purine-binding chemotaxis protein CheW [Geomesophilobacter sediminis]